MHRAQRVEATLERVETHVSPITGAVRSVDPVYADEDGVMWVYTAGHNFAVQYDSLAFLRRSLRVRSGGKGTSDAEARVGAICEALERYSGVYRGDETIVRGSYAALADEAIHPNDVMLLQRAPVRASASGSTRRAGRTRSPRSWCRGRSTSTPRSTGRRSGRRVDGSRRLLPTGMCYFNYGSYHGVRNASELCFLADSNGHAAGASLEDAALQGVLELIERDAVGIWWYNRVPPPGDRPAVGR